MDSRSRNLFLISVLAVLIGVGYAFFRFYFLGDYIVSVHITCDPSEQSCFVVGCDSEEEECSDNPEENLEHYALIEKKAVHMTQCAIFGNCEKLSCEEGEEDCTVTFCEEGLLEEEDADSCSNPEEFVTEDAAIDEAVMKDEEEAGQQDLEKNQRVEPPVDTQEKTSQVEEKNAE